MNALNHFIVHVPKKHEDTVKVGDKDIFLDPKFNEFEHRISYGEIVSATNKSLSIGDNNHVAMYDAENGHLSQCIAYRSKKTGELKMLCDWLFVEPVEEEQEDTEHNGIVTELESFKKARDVARVYMPHPELEEQGVRVGDVVGFDKHADYKIKLDNGDIVYRMRVSNISYVEVQVEEVHND